MRCILPRTRRKVRGLGPSRDSSWDRPDNWVRLTTTAQDADCRPLRSRRDARPGGRSLRDRAIGRPGPKGPQRGRTARTDCGAKSARPSSTTPFVLMTRKSSKPRFGEHGQDLKRGRPLERSVRFSRWHLSSGSSGIAPWHAGTGGAVGANRRPLMGRRNGGPFRPCAPFAHLLAKALEPCVPCAPARSPWFRLRTRTCRGLRQAQTVPAVPLAARDRSSMRGDCSPACAAPAAWSGSAAPDARLTLCRQSRIRCRDWRPG